MKPDKLEKLKPVLSSWQSNLRSILVVLVALSAAFGRALSDGATRPTINVTGSDFGFKDGRFGFSVTALTESTGIIEVSADLKIWTPVSTNAIGHQSTYYLDPQSGLFPQKYYRVRAEINQLEVLESLALIGMNGGTITLSDHAEITVPAGALTEAVEFIFRRKIVSASEADSMIHEGEAVYELEMPDIEFKAPLHVTVPVEAPKPFPEEGTDVLVLVQKEEGGPWAVALSVEPDSEEADASQPFPINGETFTVSAAFAIGDGRAGASTASTSAKSSKKVKLTAPQTRSRIEQANAATRFLITEKISKRGINHISTFIFGLDQKLKTEENLDVFRFLVTDDHSSDDFKYGAWSTRPRNPRNPRKGTDVTHIMVHDLGNVEDPIGSNKFRNATTLESLRNVLQKTRVEYAHYYIDPEGTIYQLADPDTQSAPHALCNNETAVGIEMEPTNVNGGIAQPILNSAARLTAYLVKRLGLPFDPDIEMKVRELSPETENKVKERFFATGEKFECKDKHGNVLDITTRLPNNARHVSIVGHGELQSNRSDPRIFDWKYFISQVSLRLYPTLSNDFVAPGPLIDCSAASSLAEGEMDGGSVVFETVENLNLGPFPGPTLLTDDVINIPPGVTGTMLGGKFKKVYIGEGAMVTWLLVGGSELDCGSFYLGRGAVLRLASSGGLVSTEARIRSERSIQIDGLIDGSGEQTDSFTYHPVSLKIQTGAGVMFRVPSIITRGANSRSVTVPGGQGGPVTVAGNHSLGKLMLFGRGSQVPAEKFPITYGQRVKPDYFGYGGNSFIAFPGELMSPGIITSGGGGAGGISSPAPGGNGGNITLIGGGSVFGLSEAIQFVSGTGYSAGVAISRTLSPIELLVIDYAAFDLDTEVIPAGGNGGRGSISFGNVAGGNGGNGGNAGDIRILCDPENGPFPSPYRQDKVTLLNGGVGRNPSLTTRPVHVLRRNDSETIRISAIGGSGGPRGGDSISGSPGRNGAKGKDGQIFIFGENIQQPD